MTGSGANNRDVKKINRIRTIRSIFSCDRISQPELAAKSQQQLADRIAECQRTDGDGTGAGGRHL